MTEKLNVFEALSKVMGDVQSIGKNSRNPQQGFAFRGIDAVMDAVGPALRKHGVLCLPIVHKLDHESYETRSGTSMRNVTVQTEWVFYGPDGSSVSAATYGEASDAGDKAVTKAQSVAYRTVLLQALCIPTGDPDPDQYTHERAPQARRLPEQQPAPSIAADPAVIGVLKAAKTKLNSEQTATFIALWRDHELPAIENLTPIQAELAISLLEKVNGAQLPVEEPSE